MRYTPLYNYVVGTYHGITKTGYDKQQVWNELIKAYTHHVPFKKIQWGYL